MAEFVKQVESTFGTVGIFVAALYALTISTWWLRKRSERFRTVSDTFLDTRSLRPGPRGRKIIIGVMVVVGILAFIYCQYCVKTVGQKAEHEAGALHVLVSFTLKVIPFFILGCLLSAAIVKIVEKRSNWLPTSMLGAGVFASILPICSCAAVPFSYSLLATKRIPLRAVVTFMFIVPILNPFVIPFAWGVLGWEYTVWRIVGSFVLGMFTGLLVERFAGQADPSSDVAGCTSCKGCGGGVHLDGQKAFVDLAYELMTYLAPYMIIGVTIGAMFTVYLPPYVVGKYLSAKFVGLVLAAGIGLPIYLCSGEDVLILEPLMKMGLPMGHAIALTIAGNGICLSSIALLVPLFGKRATWIIASCFFFGSIALGALINVVHPLLG